MKQKLFRLSRPWLFAFLGILSLLPQACGNAKTKTPQTAAQAFLDAISSGDYEEAKDYCTAGTRGNLSMFESFSKFGANPASGNPKTTREEVNGEYATVYYEKDGEEHYVKLRKEGDEWLVLANKADLTGGDKDKKSIFDMDSDNDSDTPAKDEAKPDPADVYKAERDGKSAKEIAIAYLDAWYAHDYELAGHYASKSTVEAMNMRKGLDEDKKEEPGLYKFLSIKEKEMTAEVTYFDHGADQEQTLKLVKDQHDNWEVAMEKTDFPSSN
jgi:hypothetical protein